MDEFMNQGVKVETTVIKRYPNRKLYDTNQSCYVTLEEIGELIKAGQNIQVIDNKSKTDITALTLFQVVTKREEKKILTNAEGAMSVFGLTEVIRNG